MTTKKTYTGRNIEVAVASAAKDLGVDPKDVKYDILAGAAGGFALIRLASGDSDVAGEERLTGKPSADHGEGGSRPERSERSERSSRSDRGDRRGRDDRDGGRRGRDDRDGGRRGRGRGRRDDRRGGRGQRGGGGFRREQLDSIFELVPTDGPSEVIMNIKEGTELSEIGEDAHEVLRLMLTHMKFGVQVDVEETDDLIKFDLNQSVYGDALVAKDMLLINAIQHLVDKTVNFDAEDRKKILLDCQGMKARRDEDLGDAAREMATKVLEEGTPMTMGPMDARSRRIVHVALKDVAGVETKSEGEGAFRRVRITASGS